MSAITFAESMASLRQGPPETYMPAIVGTLEECVEQIQGYVDVGVSLFILSFLGGRPQIRGEALR